MTTLTTPPLSTLLARLFADAQATDATLEQKAATLSPEERAKLMTSATDYQVLYSRMKDFHLAVSRETGTLLYMLARATGARSIIEFGTSFGISTLHLAAALKDNGGGQGGAFGVVHGIIVIVQACILNATKRHPISPLAAFR